MKVTALTLDLVRPVMDLMELGAPFVKVRTESDYWLYETLFSSTCPVALDDETVIGAVVAFRSQDDAGDVYVQDVVTHPDCRRHGVAQALMRSVKSQATAWGCARLYLTSEPSNEPAHATWARLGFRNVEGDRVENGIWVVANFKGPGKHRAVYEHRLG